MANATRRGNGTQDDAAQAPAPEITAMALKNAAAFLGLQDQRVRNLAKEGVLATEKREIPGVEGMQYTVYLMSSLEEYKRKRDAGELGRVTGPRGEGKSFIIRVKHDQADAVTAALAPFGITLENRQANMTDAQRQKRKEYNARRNAEKRAQREAVAAANAEAQPVA